MADRKSKERLTQKLLYICFNKHFCSRLYQYNTLTTLYKYIHIYNPFLRQYTPLFILYIYIQIQYTKHIILSLQHVPIRNFIDFLRKSLQKKKRFSKIFNNNRI